MTPPLRYPVAELFASLQGEGCWVGRPAVFLRLAGCNLRCPWCDTPGEATEVLSGAEIEARIRAHAARSVIVTGGEPTLQAGLAPLLRRLQRLGCWIGLETNGLIRPDRAVIEACDHIAVSPKASAAGQYDADAMLRQADEVRIVVEGEIDAFCRLMRGRIRAPRYYLSPCDRDGVMNIEQTVRLLGRLNEGRKRGLWQLSLQIHKLAGFR